MKARKLTDHAVPPTDGTSAFQVRFWTSPTSGDDWAVDDVDVAQVLVWARARRAGRVTTIWAHDGSSPAHTILLLDERAQAH